GSVGGPAPAFLRLFGWNLQPLLPPDALDPLVVDHPAHLAAQKLGDLAIAIAAIAAGQCDDVLGQLLLVVPAARNTPLRGAMLPQHEAYPALRHARHNSPDMVNAGTAARGAQKFPFAASDRISLSSVRSATALRSRSFSFWRSFNCRSWSRLMPPYCLRHR